MGCASSQEDHRIVSPTTPPLFSSLGTQSSTPLSAPPIAVVHHRSLGPGDSHHLVSLTSTSYGSLLFDSQPSDPPAAVIDAPQLMDGLESPAPSPRRTHFVLPRSFSYTHSTAKKPLCKIPAEAARPSLVLYSTSLRGVRRTHDDCCAVRAILRGFRVAIDERDLTMDASYRKELQSRLGEKGGPVVLPQVFLGSKHVGGAEEVRALHEAGKLGRLLEGAARQDPAYVCGACGGMRFVPCGTCSGGRKLFDEEQDRMRRCDRCNENGLVRCPNCCSPY